MAEDYRNDEQEWGARRDASRDRMRRRAAPIARRGRKRGATPSKFNGIHRRRTKRFTW